MVAVRKSQSIDEFNRSSSKILERINRTGAAELITEGGKARAVLVSPATFEEISRQLDDAFYASMKKGLREIREGKGVLASDFFDELHAKLLAMKAKEKGRRGERGKVLRSKAVAGKGAPSKAKPR